MIYNGIDSNRKQIDIANGDKSIQTLYEDADERQLYL